MTETGQQTVRVVYTKYDGALHWHQYATRLGEDQHGVWLGCPAGNTAQRGHEPPITYDHAFVLLIPRDAWWTAVFNAAPHRTEIYCDISTVPQWRDGMVTMADLDLDVVRRRGGSLFVDDEDEFAEHRVRYGYPAEVVQSAEHAAQWLMKAIGEGVEPFGGGYLEWLSLVR
ncbi:DUF402 domain-containing protein [Streptantibioticus ferralitis]|uniref:DUF402 domain-containing protein n=1 Tax=Streptantibioticus ferralitis TaxID=236510 RepID=A0ABT5Z4E2_9ACTN|nr:DUF402 domain-containing protein [Streptantibioticus ferralitis]MDF2258702.1 DUF402 domain-containing protein [Streptantibioticus ferralitis]